MRAVLISINPKWCEKIANGEKTIELRKTIPSIERQFRCYIYETKRKQIERVDGCELTYHGRGKVIGEFVCDDIDKVHVFNDILYCVKNSQANKLGQMCLTIEEIKAYLGENDGYNWHISQLKIYDKPKHLSDFRKLCPYTNGTHCLENKCEYYCDYNGNCYYRVERPPQSWCYVEISE